MHITFYKPGSLPIPPPDYGGTQRVIYYLAKTLLELGHQVTLIAHPQSHIPGAEVRPIPGAGKIGRAGSGSYRIQPT